jgi:NitT/TauT family transport system ATP-binding protein
LCDEPFAALDSMTRQIMQQELLRIVNESGQTVLFITHSIDEALILSDKIVVMSVRPGTVKDIYDIEFPHLRKVEVQLTDEYLKLKRQIWAMVEEEVKISMKIVSSYLKVYTDVQMGSTFDPLYKIPPLT